MNLLFVVPYPPSAIYIRPNAFLRTLASRGHRVTLVALYQDKVGLASLQPLQALCERIIPVHLPRNRAWFNSGRALFSAEPLQANYAFLPALLSTLQHLVAKHDFDAIHVEHLRGAKYAIALKKLLGSNGPPIIWDSVDCISLLFARAMTHSRTHFGRMMTRFELPRTRRFEAHMLSQVDAVLVTSREDADALRELAPNANVQIQVVANGVELDRFRPNESVARLSDTLVISGKMSYHANVSMALRLIENIMPLIWAQRPDVRVKIVGKDPHPSVQALAQDQRITVTGFVPNLAYHLQTATVAVAPLAYGVGIQNKVLEAMGCATPVVADNQAAGALRAQPGRHLLTADDDSSFALAALELLNNPEQACKIGRAGRSYVEQHHTWDAAAQQLEKTYSGTESRTHALLPVPLTVSQ